MKLGGNFTFGKMVSDHWAVLVNAGYVSTSNTTPQTVAGNTVNLTNDRSDFTITPQVRYYKLVSEGTYIFVQSGVMLSWGTLDSNEVDRTDNIVSYSYNTNGFGVGISPGVTYFMTKKLSTEISIGVIGYSVFNGKDKFGNTTQTNSFQSLFYQNSVSLGFVYYF